MTHVCPVGCQCTTADRRKRMESWGMVALVFHVALFVSVLWVAFEGLRALLGAVLPETQAAFFTVCFLGLFVYWLWLRNKDDADRKVRP